MCALVEFVHPAAKPISRELVAFCGHNIVFLHRWGIPSATGENGLRKDRPQARPPRQLREVAEEDERPRKGKLRL
eukprot:9200809-Alexandrium_andersonii.AAC.1